MSNSQEQPLPFGLQLTAGGISGVFEILALYPLDVVKTRAQLSTGSNVGVISSFKNIMKQEGMSTFYRGIGFPLCIEAPKRAITFATNEQFTVLYQRYLGLKNDKIPTLAMATGFSSGFTEAVVITPFELVKVRLQDRLNADKYKNAYDALKKIAKQEGILSLYNGLEATIWRHGLWNMCFFGSIFKVKELLPKATTKNEQLRNSFIAGTIAGTFGTMVNIPTDVVKSRVQGHIVGPRKYNWTFPAVYAIGKQEGIQSLYRGFVPKVLRLSIGGGLILIIYENMSDWMRHHYLPVHHVL
ncbi:mitochondrial carrier domain-containing protein [Cunninghamella echinulata]|nr:mitochondrial carrier domain-containing protein [Cunninghamella echinulata]